MNNVAYITKVAVIATFHGARGCRGILSWVTENCVAMQAGNLIALVGGAVNGRFARSKLWRTYEQTHRPAESQLPCPA